VSDPESAAPNEIFDAHSDLLLELAHRSDEPAPFARYWLEPLRRGGVRIQVCALTAHFDHLPDRALQQTFAQIQACYRAVRENSSVSLVCSQHGLRLVLDAPERQGLILSLQGSEALGYSDELVDVFWNLGVRMFALAWIRRNPFSDAVAEAPAGGLSTLGRRLLDRLTARGAIVDLAHTNDATFFEAVARGPRGRMIVSHAGCRAVRATQRNLSDAQLEALAACGGMLGITVLPSAIDPARPEISRVIDHLDHAVEVIGIDRVALGADFGRQVALAGAIKRPPDSLRPAHMGLDFSIDDLAGPEHYSNLVRALQSRGYDDERRRAILSGNLIEFFSCALPTVSAVPLVARSEMSTAIG
jgi:membrane dipeptidase